MAAYFNISPDIGFAKATTFTFTPDTDTLENYKSFLWNFGDGGTSRKSNPSYIFNNPGTYNVTLNAYNDDGTYDSYSTTILITLYLNESIYFEIAPPPTFAGHLNRYPFKLNITSSTTDDHYIDLGTQFSKSYQIQEPENKWSFLRPQCKFLDLDGNEITSIKTTDTLIKIDNEGNISPDGKVVGVSGTAQFYFVDDLFNTDLYIKNQPYSTIIATLQTSAIKSFNDSQNLDSQTASHANSLASIALPHLFITRDPDYIKITENGLKPFSKIKFIGQQNPILINLGYNNHEAPIINEDYADGNSFVIANNSEFVHSIPYNNDSNFQLYLDYINIDTYAETGQYGGPLDITFTPSNIEFKYQDNNGFKTGGYYKGSFVCNTSTLAVDLYAFCFYPIIETNAYAINPILWISNPQAGMMATAQYFYNPSFDVVTNGILDEIHINSFDMPIVGPENPTTFYQNDVMAVSGFHGINSIAALPNPTYHAWAVDSELNKIYRLNSIGQILCSIDVNQVVLNSYLSLDIPSQASPMSIAMDSEKSFWVTLYDTPYVLKFDSQGNYLLHTEFFPHYVQEQPVSFDANQWIEDSSDAINGGDIRFIEPNGIDTDIDNNIWVTYSNPFSSFIFKYDTFGNYITSFNYPLCAKPQEVACDKDNNAWFVIADDVYGNDGFLEKRDSIGNLLSSFGPFKGIDHLTIDINQNPWFTYSYQWVGNIDNITGEFNNIKIETDNNYSKDVPDWFDANENTDENSLEGIACDYLGRIFVINSIENKIFVINSNTKFIINTFNINPKGFVFYSKNPYGKTEIEFNQWSKSAQANGDWTGFRWINKYFNNTYQIGGNYVDIDGKLYKYLTGESSASGYLNYYPKYTSFYPEDYYSISKINENFDLAAQMKSVSFQPTLQDSENLYDNFLGSIFGTQPLKKDDMGVQLYEKIANYVMNQSDVDTCNIDSLYSISESVDLNTDDFRLNFPLAIKNAMNLFSINQSKLFGTELNDIYNFSKPSEYYNFNRGKLLDNFTYVVSAGTPVVLKVKSLNSYTLIPTGYLDDIYISNGTGMNNTNNYYNLFELANSIGLPYNWTNNYEFYEFLPPENRVDVENIIDWEKTNIDKEKFLNYLKNPNKVDYGNPTTDIGWDNPDGLMDFIFTYELYKGLGLLPKKN